MKQEHEAELLRLVKVEEALQKERDDAVAGLEAAKTSHQRALLAVHGQASDAYAALSEIDDQLSGKFPPATSDLTLLFSAPILHSSCAYTRMLVWYTSGC